MYAFRQIDEDATTSDIYPPESSASDALSVENDRREKRRKVEKSFIKHKKRQNTTDTSTSSNCTITLRSRGKRYKRQKEKKDKKNISTKRYKYSKQFDFYNKYLFERACKFLLFLVKRKWK